eukprot:TRINITY_DN3714_c0_g1_i1.p1 TRINITY_DN3714_c0_g1~~TRINITY_DN3714_c0_g1_i1.p1  ORF type:complete len:288 (+),score=39.88 TRINITY_DN3714_c0_g1_i1:33-896(+)
MDTEELWVVIFVLAVIFGMVYWFNGKKAERKQRHSGPKSSSFQRIGDKYKTVEEIQQALRAAGLESSNLILAIDYTGSNAHNGRNSFGGKSLHAISNLWKNPYQQVISIIGRTLEVFDEDKLIPTFGFGDITTKAHSAFPFFPDRPCYGFQEALDRYTEITPNIQLSGPTSFAPVIYEAINIVKTQKDFHVLLIIADGQVSNEKETADAIVEASNFPLSIVVVGVGDGPWDLMEEFDDGLPQRKFDNFQFVEFNRVRDGRNPEVQFAVEALMELPDQYKLIGHYFSR